MCCKVAASLIVVALLGCGPKPDVAVESAPASQATATATASATAREGGTATATERAAPVTVTLPSVVPALESKQSCSQPECAVDIALPKTPSDGATEPAPARLWEQEIAQGSKVVVPRDDALTLVVIPLTGTPLVAVSEPSASIEMNPLEGVAIRGGGVAIQAPRSGARLLLASVAGRDAKGALRRKGSPWTVRPGGAEGIVAFSLQGEPVRWGGGGYAAVIGLEERDGPMPVHADASCSLLAIGSPKGVAEHVHADEWEMLAILSGAGTMTLGKADAARKVDVKAGSLLAIPKGVPHAFVPSEMPLQAIQLYVPPGPEQRFKKLAEAK
jgi:mannose-6-phosphate isomerase-like protein (cupin superfamily)